MANEAGIGALPAGQPPDVQRWMTQVQRLLRTGVSNGSLTAAGGAGSSGSTNTTIIVGGGSGGSTTTDLTPPPTPDSVTVTAGLNNIFITTASPAFTQGNGYLRTHVYGAKWPLTDAVGPTFSNAQVVHQFSGQVGSFASDLNTRWAIWVKWESKDGVLSTSPAGGGTGFIAQTGKIGNADLNSLIIDADKLSQGTYAGVNMAPNPGAEDGTASWSFVEGGTNCTFTADTTQKVGGSQSFKIGKTAVSNTGGVGCRAMPVIPGETYSVKVRVRGSAATASGLTVRLNESATNPAGGYVTSALRTGFTDKVANAAITTAWVTHESSYTVPAGVNYVSLSVYNGVNGPVSLWFDDVQFGRQITASSLAAGSIAVGSAAIANGAITNAMIGDAIIDSAKIANAAIVTAKIADAAITNAKINDLSADKITAGLIAADRIGANSITAGKIDSRGLSIKDASGNVLFSSGVPLQSASFSAIENWDFTVSASGWIAGGAILDAVAGYVRLTPNSSDPILYSPAISVAGTPYNKVRARVRRISGSTWQGQLYYGTVNVNAHGFSEDYTKVIPDTTVLNQWVVLEWDMTSLSAGGNDWQASTVNSLRIDLGSTGDVFDVEWIAVGSYSVAPSRITASNASTYIANAAIQNAQIGGTIQSDDYSPGVQGWAIPKSGSPEFNNGTFRGTLAAAGGTFSEITAGVLRNSNDTARMDLGALPFQPMFRAGGYDVTLGRYAVEIRADGDANFSKLLASGNYTTSQRIFQNNFGNRTAFRSAKFEFDTGYRVPIGIASQRDMHFKFIPGSTSISSTRVHNGYATGTPNFVLSFNVRPVRRIVYWVNGATSPLDTTQAPYGTVDGAIADAIFAEVSVTVYDRTGGTGAIGDSEVGSGLSSGATYDIWIALSSLSWRLYAGV